MAAHTHSFLPISTNIKHTSSVKTIRIKKAQTSLAEDDIVLNKTVFLYCNLWSFLHPKSSNHGRPLLHPNRSSPLRQSHKHPPDVIDVAVRDIEKDENADKLLCNLNYNTLTTVTSLSPLPYQQENDWLEPDKEEFQRSGQETGAEITLHVDVVFEFPLIPASRWLQGFTGTIRAYATGEYRKQKVWAGVSWISQWRRCTALLLVLLTGKMFTSYSNHRVLLRLALFPRRVRSRRQN